MELYIVQNTAKMNTERARQQRNESETVFEGLQRENHDIEEQLCDIKCDKKKTLEELEQAAEREEQIKVETEKLQKMLDEQLSKEEMVEKVVSTIQLEAANYTQKAEFILENMNRLAIELKKLQDEEDILQKQATEAKEDTNKHMHDIEAIKETILASDDNYASLEEKLKEGIKKKETMSTEYKGFFQKREEIAGHITNLDKEIFRLNNQREKLEEASEYQTNYMWEEYELTPHNAGVLRNDVYQDSVELKKIILIIKDDIRKLGAVNVNAIEDYKNVLERYTFLKTQHDDLIEAEETLLGIIDDLDTGMRKQFFEKFNEIQKEFDHVFKELFGGGKGTLELVEDEDILECGIRIIAQPPGKKLQNMMQLSGGEKSLTAIALLFAIQNLKPSPFCLLDEIEAALDDSNVVRFAKYLHRLTKNTQFIVITHRRGTMTAADRLYGITMQEKGVSTVVSVNLIEDDLDQ